MDVTNYLTRKDLALQLHVSQRTVDRWIKEKKLKALKIGKLVRISEKMVEEFLNEYNFPDAR